MKCADVVETLPAYANGTLDAGPRADVAGHLAGCVACRAELDETRTLVKLVSVHPPPSALVDVAWGVAGPADAELVQRHAEACDDCGEALALARESRALEEAAPEPRVDRRAGQRRWPAGLALAAALLVATSVGLGAALLRERGRLATARAESGGAVAEAARLAADNAALRRAGEALRARLAEAGRALPNVPVIELLPADLLRTRGDSGGEKLVAPQAGFVALSLVLEGDEHFDTYRLEIQDARGERALTVDGLERQAPGALTLLVPSAQLPAGRCELRLHGLRGQRSRLVDRYVLFVSR